MKGLPCSLLAPRVCPGSGERRSGAPTSAAVAGAWGGGLGGGVRACVVVGAGELVGWIGFENIC
jgi:hypothetical protein